MAVVCAAATLIAQTRTPAINADEKYPGIPLNTGKEIYQAACVACHGPDGKGTADTTVAFKKPDTFPDFTRCDQTTAEDNYAYRAVVTYGGPFRGFSQIMPSFREALTPQQIDKVVHYLRTFCRESGWPRGELNLPRALVTEKAYPEDEEVVTTAMNAHGAPMVTNTITHEQRFGVKNQIEVTIPISFADQDHVWHGGFGDSVLGWKREIFSSLRTGSILSVQGEVSLPTGNSRYGLGSGVTTFGTFASYDQLFPHYTFVQFQGGADLPTDTKKAPQDVYFNTAIGKSFAGHHGLGRLWTPMVEALATRDLVNGATTDWDILPQMQVTISRRQHIRFDAGYRMPITNKAGRDAQVIFYLLWDWADGKINEGW